MFQVNVAGGPKLQGVANDLRRARGKLRPDLTAGLRGPTKRIYDEVVRTVDTGSYAGRRVAGARRRLPNSLGTGNHARAPVKRGLTWKVSSSASNPRAELVWNPNHIDARVRPLFPYLVRQKNRLRHPIMGKTRDGKWRGGVGQQIPDAWSPAKKLIPAAQKEAAKAVNDCADRINGRKR